MEIKHILTISFVKICIAQLDEMKRRYKDKKWMGIILRYAELELRETVAVIIDSSLYPENKDRIDREYYSMVCELKAHLHPADYLFLKSMFTQDDSDRVFFLQQAHMIEPENLRFHLISIFLDPDEDEYPEAILLQLNSLLKPGGFPEIAEYLRLLDIIRIIFDTKSNIRPREIAQFISNSSMHPKVLCSLLYHIVIRIVGTAGKTLLDRIQFHEYEENREYQLARLHVHYELKEFGEAAYWLSKLEEYEKLANLDLQLELQYKRTIILRETGKEGQAILLLNKILFSGKFDGFYSDYYFQAIVDLTGYYVRIMQPEKADRVLSVLSIDMFPYMEELGGVSYLLMMAEKAMQEADFDTALHFYSKAYQENSSPEIQKKIMKLKGII